MNVGSEKTISQILHAVNSYTSTLINQQMECKPKVRIWEGNPWDEVIRDEEMYWQKIAYTLLNPWRAGLVKDPLDNFPFSDITDWLKREGEEFLLDLFSRYKRRSEYRIAMAVPRRRDSPGVGALPASCHDISDGVNSV